MATNQKLLKKIFERLNERILAINEEHRQISALLIPACEVTLLGQMSLLANEKASVILSLAQTADMDALLLIDHVQKRN